MSTPRYALLIPVKDANAAKSRLGVGDNGQRARLMAAFAGDAISAATASSWVDVHIVGDPVSLADLADELGVPVVPDEGGGDLNSALRHAADRVAPTAGLGIAVMLADLPCLRTTDLDEAFAAASGRSFVADAAGTGTTLLIAPAGAALDPRFGVGSATAHRDSGATELQTPRNPLSSLRLDVDTTTDLEVALRFGVGVRTAQVTSSLL